MLEHPLRIGLCARGLLVALVCFHTGATAAAGSGEPLHRRIDRVMDSARVGPPVARADDAEFLRRVSLDLTGMPPSVEELRAFLAEGAADKRAKKIDRLLASPLFARHWATMLDVMLMERRPNVNVTADEWQKYLLAAAQANRPLNAVMSELLSPNRAKPKLRAAARFYLDRGSEPNLITRDVGRIFFGRDMQCAQCHNHPLVEDYQQSDYHGLLAFISPGYPVTRKEGTKETTFHAEKAGTDLSFDSVFVKNDQHVTGPRILGGIELAEPVFPPGEEYEVKPADGVLSVPKVSRRARLASLATGGANRAFNENIANRLWAMMMGRGLVHPVDLMHPSNPPSEPEVLRILTEEIVALNFNVKVFLRELALSEAYQHAIELPAELSAVPAQFAARLAEQKARTETLEAAADRARKDYKSAVKAWHQSENALIPLVGELDKAILKHSEASKKKEAARKTVSDIEAQLKARRDTTKALAEAAGRAQEVVNKLPNEKELAAAAGTFAKRSAAAAAELAAVEKARTEKLAALKKAADEATAAATPVEVARAKVQPVRESVRQKEKVVLESRRKMADSRLAVTEHQKRIGLLEAFARFKSLQERVAESDRAVVACRDALGEAKKRPTEIEAVLRQRQDDAKSAELAGVAAEKTRADAQSTLDLHQKIAKSVDAALAATETAREYLPNDSTLSGAAQKLKEKCDELQKTVPALRAKLDAAAASMGKTTDRLGSAKLALKASLDENARRESVVTAAVAALAAEESRRKAARAEFADAAAELSNLQGNQFALAQLKPLSPEQMCWSILKVTGVYDRYLNAEEADLNKKKPLIGSSANDPAVTAARAVELEQRTFDKLKGNLPVFVVIYAAAPGQPQHDFFATADQALFAANGGFFNGWIAPSGGNVSERMIKENDPQKAATDLYLTILSRPPAPDESADVVRALTAGAKEKPATVQELVWGLLTSVEFRFNH